ncbi:MFS transporter [SAR202 cluster bacterium AD-802-E10_MRT_200m]|nr:MFS transporter [SAR202 cluster bacterium AD-802-E10_MRT_200m]
MISNIYIDPSNVFTIISVLSGTAAAWGLLQPMIFSNYFGRTSQGTIQGVLRPFLAGPGLAIPLITALLFDTTGTFDIAFILAAAPGVLAIFLVLLATPPKRYS